MEEIHNIKEKQWIHPIALNISQLLLQWKEFDIQKREMDYRYEQKLLKHCNERRVKLLNKKLKEFSEKSKHELEIQFSNSSTNDEMCLKIDPQCQLVTYNLQLEHAKRMISQRTYRLSYMYSLRYRRQDILMRRLAYKPIKTLLEKARQNRRKSNVDATVGKEGPEPNLLALLTVQIWGQPDRHAKPKLVRELLVRSDQGLDAIRCHFKCVRDFSIPMDLSQDPDTLDRVVGGELYKSAFFLIGNTFYNDMRQPNNTDLSSIIIDWANDPDRKIGPFFSKRMEETKFDDITIKLGYPYLYQHQGNCEHLFTISDIQFVDSTACTQQVVDSDGKVVEDEIIYPLVTGTLIGRDGIKLKCFMCHKRTPNWFTRFNDRLPEDPFYFCEKCFLSFNYDENKRKIGQFKAYPYIDISQIPDSATMSH